MKKGLACNAKAFYPKGNGKPVNNFKKKRGMTGSEF